MKINEIQDIASNALRPAHHDAYDQYGDRLHEIAREMIELRQLASDAHQAPRTLKDVMSDLHDILYDLKSNAGEQVDPQ